MNQRPLDRTLSTQNRNVDDDIAKENFLALKRKEIAVMMTEGHLSEENGHALLLAINNYIQFNANQTKQGFERGLTNLIAIQLNDPSRTATVAIY